MIKKIPHEAGFSYKTHIYYLAGVAGVAEVCWSFNAFAAASFADVPE